MKLTFVEQRSLWNERRELFPTQPVNFYRVPHWQLFLIRPVRSSSGRSPQFFRATMLRETCDEAGRCCY